MLSDRIEAISNENKANGIKCLHQLMFTLLNGFVNYKHYDSKDRALIKLFLDVCSCSFQNILKVKHDVHMSFFLTLFEISFATRTQRDKYDIKMM